MDSHVQCGNFNKVVVNQTWQLHTYLKWRLQHLTVIVIQPSKKKKKPPATFLKMTAFYAHSYFMRHGNDIAVSVPSSIWLKIGQWSFPICYVAKMAAFAHSAYGLSWVHHPGALNALAVLLLSFCFFSVNVLMHNETHCWNFGFVWTHMDSKNVPQCAASICDKL